MNTPPLPSPTAALLTEAARLFSLYLKLPILVGSRDAMPLEDFAEHALFMEDWQPFYRPGYLAGLLAKEPDRTVRLLDDPLGTHAVLVLADETAMLIGPFVSEAYQEKRSRQLLSAFLAPDNKLLLHFRLYWCDLGLCETEAVLRAVQSMLAFASIPPDNFAIKNSRPSKGGRQPQTARPAVRETFSWEDTARKTEDRYAAETRLMHEITKGDRKAAVTALRHILQNSRPQAGMAVDLWSLDSANAIMRTLFRIAAKEAGLPAAVIDAISLDYAQQMQHLGGDYRRMNRLYEGMVSDLCREIRRMQEKGFSPLTHRALQIIRTNYAEPLKIGTVADLLGVSESTLGRSLRTDTGHTFTELLREERLREAVHLLATTDRPIQEICARSGIGDQNYFVKVFRSTYNMPPTTYREAILRGEIDSPPPH